MYGDWPRFRMHPSLSYLSRFDVTSTTLNISRVVSSPPN
jgi:hypothetical protein